MTDSPFKFQSTCDEKIDGNCKYCGSISPLEAVRLLKVPGTTFSGTDWKYGYPHKFYIGNTKFYTKHLQELSDQDFKICTDILKSVFGIEFERDEKGIKYRCPQSNTMYGFQLAGVIDKEGNPDYTEMHRV